MRNTKIILLLVSMQLVGLGFSCKGKSDNNTQNKPDADSLIFGITVDDSWSGEEKLNQILSAIKAMSVKPTVRIVMDAEVPPKNYVDEFREIHKVATVMAQPVDSYYMERYKTVESYKKRFEDSYHFLSPFTDMWEIANEINGEGWIGNDRQFNADKMYAAYEFIRNKGGKTVLVSYETAPGKSEVAMLDWLKKYVPADMKENLDYMMVSYYEDDNDDYQPDWKEVFGELSKLFPNSILAMGECGNTAKNATTESKVNMARQYYNMTLPVRNFAGGFFWWNWVQDCVPYQQNAVWEAINSSVKEWK